jgi:hypothetical protein
MEHVSLNPQVDQTSEFYQKLSPDWWSTEYLQKLDKGREGCLISMQSYQIEFHEDIAKRSVILPTQQ